MHELGLVESIIKLVKEKVDPSKKVTKINLVYGSMAKISPEHLEFHFREYVKGTRMEEVELIFNESTDSHKHLSVESIDFE